MTLVGFRVPSTFPVQCMLNPTHVLVLWLWSWWCMLSFVPFLGKCVHFWNGHTSTLKWYFTGKCQFPIIVTATLWVKHFGHSRFSMRSSICPMCAKVHGWLSCLSSACLCFGRCSLSDPWSDRWPCHRCCPWPRMHWATCVWPQRLLSPECDLIVTRCVIRRLLRVGKHERVVKGWHEVAPCTTGQLEWLSSTPLWSTATPRQD